MVCQVVKKKLCVPVALKTINEQGHLMDLQSLKGGVIKRLKKMKESLREAFDRATLYQRRTEKWQGRIRLRENQRALSGQTSFREVA